jgi:hypothetical protein
MGYISTEEVAEKRKKLKEAFPDYKFSISKDGYSGIRVAILEGTIPLLKEGENYRDVNVYYIDESFKDMPQARDVINKIYNIINEGNKRRETSDYGTQPDFYTYIYIGQSDNKPYKVIPKKSSGRSTKKGFRKFGEKKTEGFEFVESCLNGWKLFVKQVENSSKPYNYRFIKDYEVKPVGKEQFYALKGDMLETGFLWSVKAQCFEMFSSTSITSEQFGNACGVLRKYFPMTEESKKEEATPPPTPPTTTTTTKIPLKSVTLVWDDATFNNLEEVRNYMRTYYYENDESKLPKESYDKYKVEFVWEDGSKIVDRLDVSSRTHDYNPFTEDIGEYLMAVWGGMDKWNVYYSKELNTDITNLSLVDSTETKPTEQTEEVNLEQLLNDMAILLDLEEDIVKKAELEQYISDLQLLASLNN